MGIRGKVLLIGFIMLSLLSTGLGLGVAYQMQRHSNARLFQYRQEALASHQEKLKDLVDMAYTALDSDYRDLENLDFLAERYGPRLRNMIDLAEATARYYLRQAEQQVLPLDQAKSRALEAIRQMRYDDGSGYIWVNDTTRPYPVMLMHPTLPELEGQVMDAPEYDKVALHKTTHLFTAFLNLCESRGEGFVDYVWPKFTPEGKIPEASKLSYVRLLPEWGWIMGTGIYMDDARKNVLEKIKRELASMRYAEGTGYFWILDGKKNPPILIMHPLLPEAEGQPLREASYRTVEKQTDGGELGRRFVEAVAQNGKGYVTYDWPRPIAGKSKAHWPLDLKLAYLRLHRPLGWIIGSGVYINNIEEQTRQKREELNTRRAAMIWNLFGLTVLLFILFALGLLLLLRRPLATLSEVNYQLQILARGQLPEQNLAYRGRDEIAGMVQAFAGLQQKISGTIQQARAVARGQFRQSRTPEPDDQLGWALAEMTTALQEAAEQSARQDWLKTGQNRLHETLRGHASLNELAQDLIHFMEEYLSASTVLLYLWQEQDQVLKLQASHGFERRRALSNQLRPGEKLSGQAVLEKSLIRLEQKQPGESVIDAPYILAMPFFHESTVDGVIEMGRAEIFTDLEAELLGLIMQDIAIAVRAVHMRRGGEA